MLRALGVLPSLVRNGPLRSPVVGQPRPVGIQKVDRTEGFLKMNHKQYRVFRV